MDHLQETRGVSTVRIHFGHCLGGSRWWAYQGSNLGPLRCQHSALPLSYTPTIDWPFCTAGAPLSERFIWTQDLSELRPTFVR